VLQELGAWKTAKLVERYAHIGPSYIDKFVNNSRVPQVRKAA
jgi:hypothetical protein